MSTNTLTRHSILRAAALLALLFLATAPTANAREMRAAWVATVFNIDFPSRQGLDAAAQQAEIIRILDTAAALRLNALMVQVRPEGDALYRSQLEPWSRFLTGTQGQDPGYDPLEFFIREGRRRGIAIHAWINPYRAAANSSHQRARSHPSNRFPSHTHRVRNMLWFDPGSAEVRAHTLLVVRDIITRYQVAGLHLDDYFYPYPVNAQRQEAFPDNATFRTYQRQGGKLSREDWRRENVNTMVRQTAAVVRRHRPDAAFGVSPFGIYTRGQPAEVQAGLDQYHQIFADPVKWMNEGWVDYLAPQLYWPDRGPQCFRTLLAWWRNPAVNRRGTPIIPGIAVDRLGGTHNWPASEIATQLRLERSIRPTGGFILFSMKPVMQNKKGVHDHIRGR